MSGVLIIIHEADCEAKAIRVSRVPVQFEWIEVAGMEYEVTSVKHISDVIGEGGHAIVSVRRGVDPE